MANPLITIGIPTYNRAKVLPRAVESALAQDCGGIELLISDNASTDGTETYCRELAARIPTVRYFRQPLNQGPTANFNLVLTQARGDYFLFLSDDDWIDPSYVSRCIGWLRAHPDYAMAAGSPLYVRDDGATALGCPTDLRHASALRRVYTYLRAVADNATFYGVLSQECVRRISSLDNAMGADWRFVAEVAAVGKIAVLPDVRLYRSLGGNVSGSHIRITKALGIPALHASVPFLCIWWQFARDVLWRSPVYRQRLRLHERLILAALSSTVMVRRQIWLLVLMVGRWPPTQGPYRTVKRSYRSVNRWSGGRLPTLKFPGYSTVVGHRGTNDDQLV